MNLPAPAESLCLAHMAAEQAAGGSNEQLFLYIGLTNGVCQRVSATYASLAWDGCLACCGFLHCRGGSRGRLYSFAACLGHVTIDHASLSKRSTVPMPAGGMLMTTIST